MSGYLVFDIETTGLMPWMGDRLNCICAKTNDNKWFSKARNNNGDADDNERLLIREFLEWIKQFKLDETPLISFNGRQFDIPFILTRYAVLHMTEPINLSHLPYHIDLIEITKRFISLDTLASILNCTRKTGAGYEAPKMWQDGRLLELLHYCENDVNMTEECYQKLLQLGHKIQLNT